MNEDSTIRVEHDADHPYFIAARAVAQHRGLSFEARGVLLYLLSKSNNWQLQPADIAKEGNIGREQCKRILDELEKYGYIVVERNTKSSNGMFNQNKYTVYENPLTVNPLPETSPIHNTEEQKKENTTTSTSGRWGLLSQSDVSTEVTTPIDDKEDDLMVITNSSLVKYVAEQFDKALTLDKSIALAVSKSYTIEDHGLKITYRSPIQLFETKVEFKMFVKKRIEAMKLIPHITPLNALKNICKLGLNPDLEGNKGKLPGYHYWLKTNVGYVQGAESIDYGTPPPEDD